MCLLFHPNGIEKGFRTTIHIGNIRQTAYITDITPSKVKFMKSDFQNIFFILTVGYQRFNVYTKGAATDFMGLYFTQKIMSLYLIL